MQMRFLGVQQGRVALGDRVVRTQGHRVDPRDRPVLKGQRWTLLLGPAGSDRVGIKDIQQYQTFITIIISIPEYLNNILVSYHKTWPPGQSWSTRHTAVTLLSLLTLVSLVVSSTLREQTHWRLLLGVSDDSYLDWTWLPVWSTVRMVLTTIPSGNSGAEKKDDLLWMIHFLAVIYHHYIYYLYINIYI